MKHRLFTFFLAMIASVGTMFASGTQVNGIWYNFDSSTQTAEVTYPGSSYNSYSGEYTGSVVIPASVTYNNEEYSVISIGNNAFYKCGGLTSVTIPNSVTSIGGEAFSYCSSLSSVTIGNGVTNIGSNAFFDCENLTSVRISDLAAWCTILFERGINQGENTQYANPLYYAGNLYLNNTLVDDLVIPNGVTEIGFQAFAYCTSITSVTISEGVTSLGKGAFLGCSNLSSIKLPTSLTNLGTYTFFGCSNLTSVKIPNNVTIIGEYTFSSCTNLTSVEIPNSVTHIGYEAFAYCRNLTSFTNHAATPQSMDTPCFSIVTLANATLYVPAESIALYNAYPNWAQFGTIKAIGDNPTPCIIASGTCGAEGDNLAWTLSCDSVLTISGTGAMDDYTSYSATPWSSNRASIKFVIIEDGVTSIGSSAFDGCRGLTSVTIPNSVTSIGSQAFQGSGLSYVRIPSNVTSLGLGIFAGCSDLSSIDVDVNNPYYCSIDGVLFKKYNTILKQYPGGKQGAYAIPNNATSIDIAAFYGCSGLTSVEIPNSVTSIGEWAFYSCSSLTSIDIPNSVISIGRDAFWNCTGLTSVSISNSVTNIGEETFADCISLTSFTNYALQPQTINSNVFTNVDKSACTLYVPAESIALYQAADVWKDFGNILPIGGQPEVNDTLTIVEAIQIGMALDSMETSVETYTIEGYVINAGTINQSFKYQNWYMADDQETASSDFQAYRCYPIDGIDTVEVRNGSKVRMTGHLQKYYDRQKALYVVEMTYTPAIILSKPQIDTITVAEALAIGAELAENANTAKQYVIRGYVSSVTTPFSEQNGDQNFYIADDSLSTAGSNAAGGFYVYRGKPATGTAIKEGALVEITCAIKNYRNINIENHEYPVTITILQDGPECRIITGTCGDNLTWTFNNCDSVLTISGTGAMDDYTSYSATPWSSNRAFIKFVIIEDGVTSIGSSAFYNCTGLTSVTIPNSVTSIGDWAFAYCSGLTSVTIPNSVTSIGEYAFYNCSGLTSVTIPNSVTSIGSSAFAYCSSLTSPVYNAHVFAFMPTYYSGAYTIPDGIESIAGGAFGNCTGLTSVTIPNSVTSIGDGAFYNCSGLTSVTIPNSVTSIGDYAFGGCSGLTSVTIPNSVTSIGSHAFENCTGLTSVTIPNSVTSIGEYAFYNCSGLTSPVYNAHVFAFMPTSYSGAYTIPDGIESIAGGAFRNCTGLTSVTIPNSVTSIGWSAFYNCTGLTSVTIPNSVTSIGQKAFKYCTGLTSVTIPNNVTSIGDGAFDGCSNLNTITNYATIPQPLDPDGISVFGGVPLTCTLYVPAQSIEAYQAADVWKEFGTILPIEGTDEPVETVEGNYTIYYMDKDSQDLTDETVTLHVPVAPVIDGFTFVEWRVVEGSLSLGITIQAVYEANEPTSAPAVYTNPTNPAQKLIRNGNVYILTDDKIYSITGQEVR